MKKNKLLSSMLLVMVIIISGLSLKTQSKVYAEDKVISVDGGSSKEQAEEIASMIYNLKENSTLILNEGYYKISNQAYLLENNITVKGAGKDKTFIYINSNDSAWGITIKGSNCTLQDFTLERSSNPNNAAAIKIYDGKNISIKNIRTIGGFYGIDLNPSIGSIIDGCEITSTSKASIGVGAPSLDKMSKVTIRNTTTRNSGWKVDVMINSSPTYGSSEVIIGTGNKFTEGLLCNDGLGKSKIIFEEDIFPAYKETFMDESKVVYTEIPEIQLSNKSLSLEVNKNILIGGIVSPANATKNITWSSANQSIAKVDENGKITGISKGKTTITAKAGEAISSCLVTVFKVETDVPDIDVSKPTDKVDVGITDDSSKDILNGTSANIIDSIINNKDVGSHVVDSTTLNNIKEAVNNGSTITTKVEAKILEVKDIKLDDVQKIDESISQLSQNNDTSIKVAQYLDIGVMLESQKDSTNKQLGNIYQLEKPIVFKVVIPQELKTDDRKFYVVRIHNGTSTVLNTVVNDDGTLSFETDRFSTYALIYEDQVLSGIPTPDPTPKPDAPQPEVPNYPNNNVPKTNDYNNVNILIFLMGISMISIIRIYIVEKQNK